MLSRTMREAVSIIGAGRVGRALGRRLRERGWKIGAVVTRDAVTARKAVRFIGAGQPYGALTRQVLSASVLLVATPDHALPEVAEELGRIGAEELRRKAVLHTSGALDSRVFAGLRKFGAAAGSMHPLQSFSGVGVPPLEGLVFAVEGDAAALRAARQIVRALEGIPVRISGEKKPFYHAACALAAGHTLAVIEAATRLLISIGMKRREAVRALLPLTRQVLENFEGLGPGKAWTGPLSRADYDVIALHAAALADFPHEFAAAHEALNRLGALLFAREPAEVRRGLDRIFREQRVLKTTTGGIA